MNSLAIATEFEEELIQLRRYFHAHPELSWKEWNTQKKIIEVLEREGISYICPYETTVIAFVSGKKDRRKEEKNSRHSCRYRCPPSSGKKHLLFRFQDRWHNACMRA